MAEKEDLRSIYAATQSVYERRALDFDETRARDGREHKWLEMFTEALPPGGHILDLGCGTGEPISAWLIDQGFCLTGVDYSEPMLSIARERYPGAAWVLNDMRNLTIEGQFDGIISWHGSFHLTMEEQRRLLARLSELLKPNGTLMLTTGYDAGEVTGTVGGETVYHASLAPEDYRCALETVGFSDIQHFLDSGEDEPTVLLARR